MQPLCAKKARFNSGRLGGQLKCSIHPFRSVRIYLSGLPKNCYTLCVGYALSTVSDWCIRRHTILFAYPRMMPRHRDWLRGANIVSIFKLKSSACSMIAHALSANTKWLKWFKFSGVVTPANETPVYHGLIVFYLWVMTFRGALYVAPNKMEMTATGMKFLHFGHWGYTDLSDMSGQFSVSRDKHLFFFNGILFAGLNPINSLLYVIWCGIDFCHLCTSHNKKCAPSRTFLIAVIYGQRRVPYILSMPSAPEAIE